MVTATSAVVSPRTAVRAAEHKKRESRLRGCPAGHDLVALPGVVLGKGLGSGAGFEADMAARLDAGQRRDAEAGVGERTEDHWPAPTVDRRHRAAELLVFRALAGLNLELDAGFVLRAWNRQAEMQVVNRSDGDASIRVAG